MGIFYILRDSIYQFVPLSKCRNSTFRIRITISKKIHIKWVTVLYLQTMRWKNKCMKYIVLFLVTCLSFNAQNGYQLNFKLIKTPTDSLEFSVYSGTSSKYYKVDALDSQQKKATISESQKIISGIYRLNFEGAEKNDYLNIAVDNGANINFELKGKNIKQLTTNDPLNSLFIQAQNTYNLKERNALYTQLIEEFPDSVGSLYAQLELKQSEKLPSSEAVDSLRLFQEKYFENIDFNDKRIPLLPNIYASLYDYVKLLPINNDNYIAAIDNILKGHNCEERNYFFYLKWFFMNMEYLNRYNLYDSFVYTFNTYLNKAECIVGNQEFYNLMVKRLQNYEKVPLGSTIPDFEMVTKDEQKTLKISEIYPKHDYTFIAFYDPDCSHCKKKMPEINSYFNQLKEQYGLDIQQVAFLNAHSDYAWDYFIKEKDLKNWLHVKNEDPSMKYITSLDVFANPAFFLVNRKGEILMKNYVPEEMDILFKK